MLKTILSISGKPGLYKLVSQGKHMWIVESLTDKKRMPAYGKDKIISLGDIAIYTHEEEIPLHKVLNTIKEKEHEAKLPFLPAVAKPNELRAYMKEILPDYDEARVYDNDIKKLLNWYNLLIEHNLTDFTPTQEETPETKEDDEAENEKDSE